MNSLSLAADSTMLNTPVLEGIWAAVHTPFRTDFSLDEEGITRNVTYFADAIKLQGIFFNGLFGEHWSLSVAERKRIVEVAVRAAGGRIALSPNCTHHSLNETIDLAHHAQSTGCDYVVLMNPATGPRGEEELFTWFMSVADRLTSDLFIFNSPVAGYALSGRLVARLATSGRFKVLKSAGGSHEVNEARRLAGDKIIVSDPSEGTWLGNLIIHGQKLLYADAEPFLFQTEGNRPMVRMFEAYKAGELAQALEIYRSLAPMRRVYEEWVSSQVRHGIMPCAAIKLWAERRGLAAGPVRPPLSPLHREDSQRLAQILDALEVKS